MSMDLKKKRGSTSRTNANVHGTTMLITKVEQDKSTDRKKKERKRSTREKSKIEGIPRLNSSTIDRDELDDFERDPESAALMAAETR